MSISERSRKWGPSHQYRAPPRRSQRWKLWLGVVALIVIAFELFAHRLLQLGARRAATSTLHVMGRDALVAITVYALIRAVKSGRLRLPIRARERSPAVRLADRLASAERPGEAVREYSRSLGGGAVLGLRPR